MHCSEKCPSLTVFRGLPPPGVLGQNTHPLHPDSGNHPPVYYVEAQRPQMGEVTVDRKPRKFSSCWFVSATPLQVEIYITLIKENL